MDVLLSEWTTEWKSFNEGQYRQWRLGRNLFTWDSNLESTILFVFMAVNRDLRSMTIRVPYGDPRYAI